MVEWKKLGEISTVQRGKRLTKKLLSDYEVYPVYHGGIEPLGYYKDFNRLENTVMVINVGASAGSVGFSNQKFWSSDGCFCISHNKFINNKYLYFFLLGKEHYLRSQVRYAGIPTLDSSAIEKIRIPIPPLSEQNRIVGILDTFTESIENLKKQITERKKQFEHYRDQLLDLEGKPGVEMYPLKALFNTRNGYTPSTKNKSFWTDGIIPWFRMEDIREKGRILSDSFLHITKSAVKGKGLFKANSILLATSATIGEHALITVDHLSNQRFTNFLPNEEYSDSINMKFVYYYMFKIDEWCKQHTHQGGFASVDMDGLYKQLFPLPTLEEQSRIVSILDTFEASITNLEAQLSLRQKQYEYYRNMLLTFDE